MSSKDFVLRKIKELHNRFMSFTFRYEYDKLDNSHVIEYSPFDLTSGNMELDKAIDNLYNEFMEHDYPETLVVIDENDHIGILNAEKVYKGVSFFTPSERVTTREKITIEDIRQMDSIQSELNFALAA